MQRLIVSDHHSLLDTDDGDHDVFIEWLSIFPRKWQISFWRAPLQNPVPRATTWEELFEKMILVWLGFHLWSTHTHAHMREWTTARSDSVAEGEAAWLGSDWPQSGANNTQLISLRNWQTEAKDWLVSLCKHICNCFGQNWSETVPTCISHRQTFMSHTTRLINPRCFVTWIQPGEMCSLPELVWQRHEQCLLLTHYLTICN
jgi:hypothetical protein